MAANYNSINNNQQGLNHPYGAGDPYYAESTGYITPQKPAVKRGTSNWIKIGVPVLIVVIVAAVVGGVLGSRAANKNTSASSNGNSGSSSGDNNSPGASVNLDEARFATATNSKYMQPLYPSTVSLSFWCMSCSGSFPIMFVSDCRRILNPDFPSRQ